MEVEIMFVKIDGTERIEIPYNEMDQEEKDAQGRKLKTRFFESLGYTPEQTV